MDPQRAILELWPSALSASLEMLTGSDVSVSIDPGPASASYWWQNQLTGDAPVTIATGADRETWMAIGSAILSAAGIEQPDEQEVRTTWIELLEQAASSLAGSYGQKISSTVESRSGSEVRVPEGQRHRVSINLNGQKLSIQLALQTTQQLTVRRDALPATNDVQAKLSGSRTIDALLDVHLPVSISFGQARMPLKDVLKPTSGTVVELNRQPEDLVDVIVNDCVIARGEVVVVDGNYAVRIQSIIGRQERVGLGIDRLEHRKSGS